MHCREVGWVDVSCAIQQIQSGALHVGRATELEVELQWYIHMSRDVTRQTFCLLSVTMPHIAYAAQCSSKSTMATPATPRGHPKNSDFIVCDNLLTSDLL